MLQRLGVSPLTLPVTTQEVCKQTSTAPETQPPTEPRSPPLERRRLVLDLVLVPEKGPGKPKVNILDCPLSPFCTAGHPQAYRCKREGFLTPAWPKVFGWFNIDLVLIQVAFSHITSKIWRGPHHSKEITCGVIKLLVSK